MADHGEINTSPLFALLPAELRLQIYEELFEGSTATYKRRHTVGSRTQLSILMPSQHRNFLLTCNQAYDEAIKAYWGKTTLCGDPEDDELTFFLDCIVPNFAKLHVKHIRGLNCSLVHERPVGECLKGYRKLQIVGFENNWFVDVGALGSHGSSPTMEEWAKKHHEAQPWLRFSKLVCEGGPAVFCRGVYSLACGVYSLDLLAEKFSGVVQEYTKELKICLHNCSTDKISFADGTLHQEVQEAGFATLLDE